MKEIIYDARLVDLRELETKNYNQAAMLMERDLTIRLLRKHYAEARLVAYRMRDMSIFEEHDKELEEDKEKKILPFPRLAIDNQTGGPPGGQGWLSNLEEGCVFLSIKNAAQDDEVEQWHIVVKWKHACLLFRNMPPHRGEEYKMVYYPLFSARNKLIEILQQRKIDE